MVTGNAIGPYPPALSPIPNPNSSFVMYSITAQPIPNTAAMILYGGNDLLHLFWDTKLAEPGAAMLVFPVDAGFAEYITEVPDANHDLHDAADNVAHDRHLHEEPN